MCPTLCDLMDCSTPGLSVHHQLPEFTQTLVHWVGDAMQPSHPLSSPSPPAFSLSQHQGLFKWVNSSHQVAKILEFLLQHQSFHAYVIKIMKAHRTSGFGILGGEHGQHTIPVSPSLLAFPFAKLRYFPAYSNFYFPNRCLRVWLFWPTGEPDLTGCFLPKFVLFQVKTQTRVSKECST